MPVSLIAAVANNNCIGNDGTLPWHLPEDLKHFKQLTVGKTVLMGRKTWESIPERFRPLPDRKNAVVTRQADYAVPEGVLRFSSLEDAFAALASDDVVVIGGADIYAQSMDKADRLFITHVDRSVDGDAFFPVIDPNAWRETEREDHDGFSFVTYTRA